MSGGRVHFCGVMGLLFTLAFVAALVLNMVPRLSAGVERFEVVSGDSGSVTDWSRSRGA